MLTLDLRTGIDKKWQDCWPVSQLKPLIFLDLLSYLLFLKKIEEWQSGQQLKNSPRANLQIYTGKKDETRWSIFKELDAADMHEVFIKPNGILDFIKKYGSSNNKYSQFVKEPLLLIPSAGLLANTIQIVKTLEQEDTAINGEIFEYLLGKVESVSTSGQVHPPRNVVKLMISVIQPEKDDLVLDPAAGYGSFLVNCLEYTEGGLPANQNLKKAGLLPRYEGIVQDAVQLRICAMNLILHGIEDPPLKKSGIVNDGEIALPDSPTLILANLIFDRNKIGTGISADTLKHRSVGEREIDFLNFIIKNLASSGRAAVILPSIMLYDFKAEIKGIRQKIVTGSKLEAVITLPLKPGSVFSGAAIVIFSKSISANTDKTWFYKFKTNSFVNEDKAEAGVPGYNEEYEESVTILRLWKNRKENRISTERANGLYVSSDDIKNNNYSFSFTEHAAIQKLADQYRISENMHDGIRKSPGKRRLLFVLISLLIVAAVLAIYFFYFNNSFGNIFSSAKQGTLTGTAAHGAKRNVADTLLPNANTPSAKNYMVITKTYFHKMPDKITRGSAYIDHRSNTILHAIDDKKGFIYVIYTNKLGKTTKGWLNKKDLKAL